MRLLSLLVAAAYLTCESGAKDTRNTAMLIPVAAAHGHHDVTEIDETKPFGGVIITHVRRNTYRQAVW